MACLMLTGCAPLWNAVNRSGLESDVRQLLKTAAVVPQHLYCRMLDSKRDASCTLQLSPSETASVIRALALKSIHSLSDPPTSLARLNADAGPSCVAGSASELASFGIAGRPNSLRLPSGSAFEYLLLFSNESTGQACIQVSYSYG
jgi:hypothetical protein